ncbi:hypothetical protein BS78_03G125600 [Paspalum vaginatum]|nr:hypothetical protein BS78_03G125600 [Paspalum vaginatum]
MNTHMIRSCCMRFFSLHYGNQSKGLFLNKQCRQKISETQQAEVMRHYHKGITK